MAILDEYVTGHIEAKKALCVLAQRIQLRNTQKYIKEMHEDFLIKPLKLLLLGSSGTGKTHLVNTITDNLGLSIIKIDATSLQPTGASGGITSKKLSSMIHEQAKMMHEMFPFSFINEQHAVDSTIVYVDEIDKLGLSFDSTGNWNRHTQSNFLTIFDDKDTFAGVSFIFSGAFDSITREQKEASKIGFTPAAKTPNEHELLDDKILKAGIIPELLGRINMVVELDRFTKQDFVYIINERVFPKKAMDLAAYGIFDLRIGEDEVDAIAERTVKSGQGVRYAQREIDRLFLEHEFEAEWQDTPLLLEQGL